MIQENSLPCLKHPSRLKIGECFDLEMLPEEMKFMSSLRRLEIINMLESFTRRIQGVDSYKVCHVPTVIINRRSWRPKLY